MARPVNAVRPHAVAAVPFQPSLLASPGRLIAIDTPAITTVSSIVDR